MPSTKEKLLEALDLTIHDLSEERLIDILLDSYQAKQSRIEELEVANVRERQDLYNLQETHRAEFDRMRRDPLLLARGEYYFLNDTQRFKISIQGNRMELVERKDQIDYLIQQVMAQW